MVQGEGNIKYTYHNGIMATNPKTASMNFLNALEKITGLYDSGRKNNCRHSERYTRSA